MCIPKHYFINNNLNITCATALNEMTLDPITDQLNLLNALARRL